MNVKKIFIILVTVVACVVLGAFVLNILMPNVTRTLVNSVETMVYNATGLDFDWNGDTISGGSTNKTDVISGVDSIGGGDDVGVKGFSTTP